MSVLARDPFSLGNLNMRLTRGFFFFPEDHVSSRRFLFKRPRHVWDVLSPATKPSIFLVSLLSWSVSYGGVCVTIRHYYSHMPSHLIHCFPEPTSSRCSDAHRLECLLTDSWPHSALPSPSGHDHVGTLLELSSQSPAGAIRPPRVTATQRSGRTNEDKKEPPALSTPQGRLQAPHRSRPGLGRVSHMSPASWVTPVTPTATSVGCLGGWRTGPTSGWAEAVGGLGRDFYGQSSCGPVASPPSSHPRDAPYSMPRGTPAVTPTFILPELACPVSVPSGDLPSLLERRQCRPTERSAVMGCSPALPSEASSGHRWLLST